MPVYDSVVGVLLRYTHASYLATIHRGLILIIVAQIIGLALVFPQIALEMTISRTHTPSVVYELFSSTFNLAVSIVATIGVMHFTTDDHRYLGIHTHSATRAAIRTTAIIELIIRILLLTLDASRAVVQDTSAYQIAEWAFYLFDFAVGLVNFIATMLYVRWLARRVPDIRLAARSMRYAWLLPIIAVAGLFACFTGPFIATVMHIFLLNRLRLHLTSILATGKPADLPGRHA